MFKKHKASDNQLILLVFMYDEGEKADGYVLNTLFYKSFRLFVSFRKI